MIVDPLPTYAHHQNHLDPESLPESYSNANHSSYMQNYPKLPSSYESFSQQHNLSLDKRSTVPSFYNSYDESSFCKSNSVSDSKFSEIARLPAPTMQPMYSALALTQTASNAYYPHEFLNNLNSWQASQSYVQPLSCAQTSPERSDSGFSSPKGRQSIFTQSFSNEKKEDNEAVSII